MLQSWVPNTLPLPYPMMLSLESSQQHVVQKEGAVQEQAQLQAVIVPVFADVDDNFTKGQVIRYFQHQGYGFLVDKTGRELYFKLSELDFVGENNKEALKAGVPVGFDVSITSRGLHVKKLKIY